MKKIAAILTASAFLLVGVAAAQDASHDVEITIPNVVQVRIVDGSGNDASATASVVFDYAANAARIDEYIAAVNSGGDTLAPTTVTDFSDIHVFSNRASWNVTVSTAAFAFVANVTGASANGVAASDITVTPSGAADGSVTTRASSYALDEAGAIASGDRTTGWAALGISGADYALSVDGDEEPGTYTTTVTYTVTAP